MRKEHLDCETVIKIGSLHRRLNLPAHLQSVTCIKNNAGNRIRSSESLDFCFELSGTGDNYSIVYDSRLYSCRCPCLWVHLPGHPPVEFDSNGTRETMILSFDAKAVNFFRERGVLFERNGFPGYSFIITQHMHFLISELFVKLEQKEVRGIADRLDILACEIIFESFLNTRSRSNPRTSDETGWNLMINISVYIDHHVNTRIDLGELCERFSISRRSLFRYWKKHFNSTPAAYIARKRMQLAAYFIRNTELKLFEIAEKCGYSNQTYFSSEFRRFHGMTPHEYRRENIFRLISENRQKENG